MALEYRVISFIGYTNDIGKPLEKVMKEITASLSMGATLVGGINIATMDTTRVVVSQAITIRVH
jgi:hypothetical protein